MAAITSSDTAPSAVTTDGGIAPGPLTEPRPRGGSGATLYPPRGMSNFTLLGPGRSGGLVRAIP